MVLITRWLRLLVHHGLHATSKLLRPLLRLLRLRCSIGTVCASVRILRCVLRIAVSMMQHLVLILLALEQPHNSSCIAVVLSPKHNTLRLPRWRWTSLLSDQRLACLLTKHCTVSIPQSSLEPVYNRDPFYQDLCLYARLSGPYAYKPRFTLTSLQGYISCPHVYLATLS